MKVAELIEWLQKQPQSAVVGFYDQESGTIKDIDNGAIFDAIPPLFLVLTSLIGDNKCQPHV